MSQLAVFSVLSVLFALNVICVNGHGTVHDPVARQTRWRIDATARRNYDDVGVFCGGFNTQWAINDGRCGVCGDNFQDRTPRAHELGGTFGQGVIVKSYRAGQQLPVRIQITANHLGYFYFQLCNLDQNGNRESDACFAQNRLRLTNGADVFPLPSPNAGWFDVMLQIPAHIRCNHCVLQWTYVAGNNWGICANGSGKLGCGPQEHFRACSDIRIQ